MIRSFRCTDTERVFRRELVRAFPADIQPRVYRKQAMLHAASRLDDPRVPPGYRLELLRGRRAGQHSIRVNDEWRICFVWNDGGADQVELVDYP